jgi:hypothetical protein
MSDLGWVRRTDNGKDQNRSFQLRSSQSMRTALLRTALPRRGEKRTKAKATPKAGPPPAAKDGAKHEAGYAAPMVGDHADTELSESAHRNRLSQRTEKKSSPRRWESSTTLVAMISNGIPFEEHRTEPWKLGWIDVDIKLGTIGEGKRGVSEKCGVSLYGMGRFPVHALPRTTASHPGECAGDRGVHPRKRLQAENEGVGH